ncbi:MAG: hypothetical protein JNM56_23905 [Planctomycetia bacterium]|nr:hypothetical protein [Planctomycetia bacterium]
MPLTCAKCSRANPDDASYCYNDGVALPAQAGRKAPAPAAPAAAAGFSQPFVFPSGQQCRNFDQLALACQQNWSAAVDMLKRGDLEKFLGSQGRADLAMAARQAAQYPDKDRGLDKFLERLPTKAIQAPKLQVEPSDLNLGQLEPGKDKKLELKLKNTGSRLLYGSIRVVDCPWITLGSTPGSQQKLFQFGSELKIQVNIRGKNLRASNKALEGKLLIEWNGGPTDDDIIIPIKAEVPIKPFPEGVLAGARSPRQIAEKAKSHPKEAALQFEKGMVARWYKENGWTYPVKGATSQGLGAVQQFFEALGLTPPPKVHVGVKRVDMKGEPHQSLKDQIEVKTDEKRPVYAHAVSDQPWLEVGRAVLNGRVATIPLRVSAVPDRVGDMLHAKVLVTSNGNQKFVIPVSLKIGQGLAFVAGPNVVQVTGARKKPMSKVHLLPLLLLMLCLFLIFLWDWMRDPTKVSDPKFAGNDQTDTRVDNAPKVEPLDYINRVHVQFSEQQRFGIVCPRLRDPRNPEKPKLLTRDERGITNNTCVRIEGYEYIYGVEIPGVRYVRDKGKIMKEVPIPGKDPERARQSVWETEYGRIRVTQSVEIMVGEVTRLYDTALVKYHIWNRDRTPHTVGIRVMLDTLIGANDGVPFYIPPTTDKPERFVQTMEVFAQKDIPDFVQAVETGNLNDPDGTVAVVGLKLKGVEPIEKMVICRWPQNSEARWGGGTGPGEWQYEPMDKNPNAKDSGIMLYWAQANMKPDEHRDMAFTYGLGRILSDVGGKSALEKSGGRMRLFTPRTSLKKPFITTAYIKANDANQVVTLSLPPGITFAEGERAEKQVPPATREGYSQVTWRLKAAKSGEYELKADAPSIGVATDKIRINDASIFD